MSELISSCDLSPSFNLEIRLGDITCEQVDAIVNAANAQLSHGGGVAASISIAGGPSIQQESDTWVRQHGPVSHSKPAHTSAGRLPCKYVIHAVGPVWGSGDEERKLSDAVRGSLVLADELGCTSLALPAISTGIFGFPKDSATRVILAAIQNYFNATTDSKLARVVIVLYSVDMAQLFAAQAGKFFKGN